jgi:hypothetical protein
MFVGLQYYFVGKLTKNGAYNALSLSSGEIAGGLISINVIH